MRTELKEGCLTVFLEGRIDSNNAQETENSIRFESEMVKGTPLVLDATQLEYISSAGLRVLLKLKKEQKGPLQIWNVSDAVFDILDTTGFTNILDVHRPLREVSITGCREISGGLNGTFYELTDDEMIKVYDEHVTLNEVMHERELSSASLIAGVPTLIPYDVVRCGSGYGIVFEKTKSSLLMNTIKEHPDNVEYYAKTFANTLRDIHSVKADHEPFMDIRMLYRKWMEQADGLVAQSVLNDLDNLIKMIPESNTYVNGNLNLSNLIFEEGEILLVDMAGSAYGHPIFDLQSLYASLVVIPGSRPGYSEETFGIKTAECKALWDTFFTEYLVDVDKTGRDKMNILLMKCFVLKEKLLLTLEQKKRR